MTLRQSLETLAGTRFWLFTASVIYAVALLYCLGSYASLEWAEYGYSYGGISVIDGLIILTGLGIWSLLAPRAMTSASSTILMLVLFVVCIPGLVLPLGLERTEDDAYHAMELLLILSYAMSCAVVRATAPKEHLSPKHAARLFVPALLVLWATCLVWLVAEYRSVMAIVSLDLIYEQREAGLATSRWMGYAQTYFGYVLSPALLVFGLIRRNFLLVMLGFVGGLILYSITAEKNAFAFPFIIVGFSYLLSRRSSFFRSAVFLMLLLAGVLFAVVALNQESLVAAFLAWYVGVRSLLTPGLFIAQYLDFFAARGYTHLSHVTGFGSVVPPPPGLQGDRWPSLGHIVGEQYIGKVDLNANANFIASDGIASFGEIGIVIAFLLLSIFLVAFDRVSQGIPGKFTILIALPIGLTLTNVSLFTVVLSFGGLFWLVAMSLFFERTDGGRHSTSIPQVAAPVVSLTGHVG